MFFQSNPEPDDNMDKRSDFDPDENRVIPERLTNIMGFIFIMKATFGIGIGVMPDAFRAGGYMYGIIFTILTGLLIISGLNILLRNMYKICKIKREHYMSYAVSMQTAISLGPKGIVVFRKFAKYCVYLVMLIFHFSIACTYVLLTSESIRRAFHFGGKTEYDRRFFDLALVLPILLLFTITNPKILMVLAIFGFITQIGAIALFVDYSLEYHDPDSQRIQFASITTLPLLYGEAVYILEGFGVILAVQERVKNRKMFIAPFGLLNKSLVVIMLLYLGSGFLGYWKFGKNVKKSVILNLPPNELRSQTAFILYAVSLLITFTLQGFVIVNLLFHHTLKLYIEDYNYAQYECSLRACIAGLSVFGAMTVKSVYHFIPLVGAFCISLLAIVFPGLMDYCVRYPDNYGRYSIYKIRDIMMMLCGCIFGVLGFFTILMHSLVAVNRDIMNFFEDQ